MSDEATEPTHDVLRFITAGSVDDGKSTLIGRLLYDTKTIFEDQLEQVEDASRRRGDERVDLALLTDGLRAEREQGITIDVAYRYFSTPKRKFIIADAPGHAQYTRNMVTGASTANLAIVLIDARHGVVEQTRRHTIVSSLLGVHHIVFAVNKMDLVEYGEDAFEYVRAQVTGFLSRLPVRDVTFIPMSALNGDNVVERSEAMPWYRGPSLLEHLETVHIASDRNLIDVRLPVQWVIRPQSEHAADYRGYAGVVASGVLKAGDEAVLLPGGQRTRIERLEVYGEPVEQAYPPMAATVHLADQIDVSRGDMLCRPGNQPTVGRDLDAMVVWFGDTPMRSKGRYALKHTTRWLKASVTDLRYELDVDTLHRNTAVDALAKNAIGRVRLRSTAPLFYDPYERNRSTGSFILVDEATHETVGAGMLLPASRTAGAAVGQGHAGDGGFFVTGTDTGVGKTLVSAALIHLLRGRDVDAVGFKPIASGSESTADGLRNDDALALMDAASQTDYDAVNPYCFEPPIAPHIAAAQAGVTISLESIEEAYRELSRNADAVVVEGAGGYRVPLDDAHTLAELPHHLGLGAVLVVGIRLGCINHALLTAEAMEHDGVPLLGWVANCIDPSTLETKAQIETLRSRLHAPLLGVVPYLDNPTTAQVADCLDVAPLLDQHPDQG